MPNATAETALRAIITVQVIVTLRQRGSGRLAGGGSLVSTWGEDHPELMPKRFLGDTSKKATFFSYAPESFDGCLSILILQRKSCMKNNTIPLMAQLAVKV